MTTEVLIQKCIKKDPDAWGKFTHRYRALVLKSVRYKLCNMQKRSLLDEASDIAQNIFLKIWEKNRLENLKDPKCLESWLVVVSINETCNYVIQKTTKETESLLSLEESVSGERSDIKWGSVLASFELDPAQRLEISEIIGLVKHQILMLPPRQQLAIKLNLYHGKKQRDVARIMRVTEKTAGAMIQRSKIQIKDTVKEILKT